MKTLWLKVNLGDDALSNFFQEEMGEIVQQLLTKLRAGQKFGSLFDTNGNNVGRFNIKEEGV